MTFLWIFTLNWVPMMEGMAINFFAHAREDNQQLLLDFLEEKLRKLKPTTQQPGRKD